MRVRPMLVRILAPLVALLALGIATACDGDEATPTATATTTATGTQGAGGGTATATPPAVSADVRWEDCRFDAPADVDLVCGALDVPADRDDPGGGTVVLRFAVIDSRADDPPADPIVYLAGGPGQSALKTVPVAFGQVFEPLLAGRDLILVDQRGTGFSEPSLACDEYTAWARESLGTDLPIEQVPEEGARVLEACRARLAGEGIDFADYSSAASAADLEDLRRALGHEQWNLYGTSYGTRLALTAMRDDPDGIRSVVLDAAYPLQANLYVEAPDNAQRAFDALFDLCARDAECSAEFPSLEQRFSDLVARLNASPASMTVLDPTTGQRFDQPLNGDALAGLLFQSLYATDLVQFLPEIIAAADEGDFGTIGLLSGAFVAQLDLVNIGMQLAVQCHEEVAFAEPDAITGAAEDKPLLRGFFQAAITIGAQLPSLCEQWRVEEPAPVEDEPVSSDIPTLILAGSLDPITPPSWGRLIADELDDGRFFEFPYTGHGVVVARECGASLTLAFFDDPASPLDATCIDHVPPPSFTAEGVDVEMTPHTEAGVSGLRPEAWTEVFPGVFRESPLVALIQQVVPGVTTELVLQQIAAQTGAETPAAPVGTLETEHVTWQLYELRDVGQAVDLALADHERGLLLVQLNTTPLRRDVYYEQVFLPAVEAFDPSGASPPATDTPAATGTPEATGTPPS